LTEAIFGRLPSIEHGLGGATVANKAPTWANEILCAVEAPTGDGVASSGGSTVENLKWEPTKGKWMKYGNATNAHREVQQVQQVP
jgi:hypothetical protein